MNIIIHPIKDASGLATTGTLTCGELTFDCILGKGGVLAEKREGDGATPLGTFAIRQLFYRPDVYSDIETGLSKEALAPNDGWCDDPQSPAYNRFVSHPCPFGAEHLWRDDGIYDLIVVLGHNDDPVILGDGSAIFMHICRNDKEPTEGCIALDRVDLLTLLKAITVETTVTVTNPD